MVNLWGHTNMPVLHGGETRPAHEILVYTNRQADRSPETPTTYNIGGTYFQHALVVPTRSVVLPRPTSQHVIRLPRTTPSLPCRTLTTNTSYGRVYFNHTYSPPPPPPCMTVSLHLYSVDYFSYFVKNAERKTIQKVNIKRRTALGQTTCAAT